MGGGVVSNVIIDWKTNLNETVVSYHRSRIEARAIGDYVVFKKWFFPPRRGD